MRTSITLIISTLILCLCSAAETNAPAKPLAPKKLTVPKQSSGKRADTNWVTLIETVNTNLATTITKELKTNSFSGNNQEGCMTCELIRVNPSALVNHPPHGAPQFKPATMKWDVTTTYRHITMSFKLDGQTYTNQWDKVIVAKTNIAILQPQWTPVQ